MNVEITINPQEVFELLEQELPPGVFGCILVAGSLAAAYHYRGQLTEDGVKTKDADLILHPADKAAAGSVVAEKLLDDGWKPRMSSEFVPGTETTPANQCPAIRLYPPTHDRYFIELLIVPSEGVRGREWQKVNVGGQYYGLPTFEFMALLTHRRRQSGKIEYADPAMMALANLLSHPELDNDPPMSTLVAGREIHRSSKDLGRILALAHLTDPDELDTWVEAWLDALKAEFPARWVALLRRTLAPDCERYCTTTSDSRKLTTPASTIFCTATT